MRDPHRLKPKHFVSGLGGVLLCLGLLLLAPNLLLDFDEIEDIWWEVIDSGEFLWIGIGLVAGGVVGLFVGDLMLEGD